MSLGISHFVMAHYCNDSLTGMYGNHREKSSALNDTGRKRVAEFQKPGSSYAYETGVKMKNGLYECDYRLE